MTARLRPRPAPATRPHRRRAVGIAGLALLVGFGALSSPAVAAGDKPSVLKERIGKPIQMAQELIGKGRLAEAIAVLKEAHALAGKTRLETHMVLETLGVAYLRSGDSTNAAATFEAGLATGVLTGAEAAKRLAAVAQLAARGNDHARVVTAASRYFAAGGGDEGVRVLLARAQYATADYGAAGATLRALAEASRRAGRPAPEDLLLLLLACEQKRGDDAGAQDALETLAGAYPNKTYWVSLLARAQGRPGFARRLALDVDRLMRATGATDGAAALVQMAQRALEAGFPAEAAEILDAGFAAGALGHGTGAERANRMRAMAAREASTQLTTLAATIAEAEAAADGQALVQLGEILASHGQFGAAISAMTRGIAKGGLKFADDARLHLAIVYLRAGRAADARGLFAALTASDGTGELARLWAIVAKGG